VSQNQADFGLSVAPQNRQRDDSVGHALRSDRLVHVEASRIRVFQSGLKTDRGAITGGAHGTITDITSGSS
jgi:hypothetical protein